MKIDVLGARYTVVEQSEQENPKLQNLAALCEQYARKIILRKMPEDADAFENLERYKRETLRHEIIHAFLMESGLGSSCDWAKNEELVDWIAIQFPKMLRAFAAAGCVEE